MCQAPSWAKTPHSKVDVLTDVLTQFPLISGIVS